MYSPLATSDQLTRVHDDVKTIPGEVWRIGDPKLEAMATHIETRIGELKTSIDNQLDPGAVNARAAIQLEFDQMNDRLSDIAKTLLTLSPAQSNTKKPTPVVGYMGKQPKDTQEK
jgi:hypothetical protein